MMDNHMNDTPENTANTDYISISEAEKITGIANATLKRYILNHSQFVPHKKQGREYRIRLSDIEKLKLIRKYYVDGLKKDDVNLKLEAGGLPITYTSNSSEGTELISVNETVQELNRKLDLVMQFNQKLMQERENDKQQMALDKKELKEAFQQEIQELKTIVNRQESEKVTALRLSMEESKQAVQEAFATAERLSVQLEEEKSRGFFSRLFGK